MAKYLIPYDIRDHRENRIIIAALLLNNLVGNAPLAPAIIQAKLKDADNLILAHNQHVEDYENHHSPIEKSEPPKPVAPPIGSPMETQT